MRDGMVTTTITTKKGHVHLLSPDTKNTRLLLRNSTSLMPPPFPTLILATFIPGSGHVSPHMRQMMKPIGRAFVMTNACGVSSSDDDVGVVSEFVDEQVGDGGKKR